MRLVRIVKETLSVARVPSRVGGSFLMVILKVDGSADGLLVQPGRKKIRAQVKIRFGKIFRKQIGMKTGDS